MADSQSAGQYPGPGFELGVNAMLHVVILWSALTGIFVFIISRTERAALTDNLTKAVNTGLTQALNEANAASNGDVKTAMQPLQQPLEVLIEVTQGEDRGTAEYNKALIVYSLLILAVFVLVLVTMLATLSGAAGYAVGKLFAYTLVGNIVLFVVAGSIEFSFFELVAAKFVPIKPSKVSEELIQDMKNTFKTDVATVTPLFVTS